MGGLELLHATLRVDFTNNALKVAHCSNDNCTSATNDALDTGGEIGRYTSITIGIDGWGLISYQDATNQDLKVAHCSDLFCVRNRWP